MTRSLVGRSSFALALLLSAAYGPVHAQTIGAAKWCNVTVRPYYINQWMWPDYVAPIKAAATTWGTAGAKFSYSYAGTSQSFPKSASSNDYNTVVDLDWTSSVDYPGEAPLRYTTSGCLVDADIILDYRRHRDGVWSFSATIPADKVDVQGVATHEFGHVLGLGHDSQSYAVMHIATYAGENQRALTTRDKDGAKYIYGAR